jgi:hypothetical protein
MLRCPHVTPSGQRIFDCASLSACPNIRGRNETPRIHKSVSRFNGGCFAAFGPRRANAQPKNGKRRHPQLCRCQRCSCGRIPPRPASAWSCRRTNNHTYRWADGNFDRLLALDQELVAQKVDVIIALGPAVWAAKRTTATIPIVIAFSGDPVGPRCAQAPLTVREAVELRKLKLALEAKLSGAAYFLEPVVDLAEPDTFFGPDVGSAVRLRSSRD